MKKLLFALGLTVLLALCMPGSAEDYTLGGYTITAEEGRITRIQRGQDSLPLAGLYVDVGCDGAFVQNSIGYQHFRKMNTWDLAAVVPRSKAPLPPEKYETEQKDGQLILRHQIEGLTVEILCTAMESALRFDARILSGRAYISEISGIHFFLRGAAAAPETVFSFPGNTPGGVFRLGAQRYFSCRQTNYCCPVVMVSAPDAAGFNAVFLDTEEKWSTAVYRDKEERINVCSLAMVEGMLQAGESMSVGSLFLQFTGQDPYAPLQALYAELGYRVPDAGFESGPLYSCHPAGTMDSGFRDTKTMRAYASSLDALQAMGIENIWVLPIFEHTGRGVYEPVDQSLIDPRYGDDEDVRFYVDQAREKGMRVLFDYVPHGPYPQDPLAAEHPEWCSVARDGTQQIEWDCVSFDMANEDYQAYTSALIRDHAARFGVSGGRIDCAMGGLSNWRPFPGNRASSSSLKGGVGIVRAIRRGFEESGVNPVLLPENFHPIPFYASVTDIFYDMPLYRMMYELRQKGASETEFAVQLARWLDSEHRSSVPGQLKLRFLGNHDTVSWTWDKMRATAVYGEEKAKALWTVMSFIDGVPFLYMGDENSELYHFKYGYDLTEFFTGLFAARKQYLSDDMDTVYLLREDSPVLAFFRKNSASSRLIFVNLSKEERACPLPSGSYAPLYGDGSLQEGMAVLPAYGCLMLDQVQK